ncbi:hypothetical protein PJO48_29795, partial [Mycobacterium kansasii]
MGRIDQNVLLWDDECHAAYFTWGVDNICCYYKVHLVIKKVKEDSFLCWIYDDYGFFYFTLHKGFLCFLTGSEMSQFYPA